jgi:hypothetical protein
VGGRFGPVPDICLPDPADLRRRGRDGHLTCSRPMVGLVVSVCSVCSTAAERGHLLNHGVSGSLQVLIRAQIVHNGERGAGGEYGSAEEEGGVD